MADRGFAGLVLVLGPGFDTLEVDGRRVRAGAALSLPVLARRTAAAGLSGLEWAVGVPGSVGGAIRMNAGGHGSDIAATLVELPVDRPGHRVGRRLAGATGWRPATGSTALAPTEVVVSGDVPARGRAIRDEGAAAIAEIVRWRRANQPGGSNAGSVFTNPPGDSAGRLIDACGLKGVRIGTAEVSTKHANFIQADPGGSADDVLSVIEHVRAVVAGATGTELRTEVRLVGFPGSGRAAGEPPDPPEAAIRPQAAIRPRRGRSSSIRTNCRTCPTGRNGLTRRNRSRTRWIGARPSTPGSASDGWPSSAAVAAGGSCWLAGRPVCWCWPWWPWGWPTPRGSVPGPSSSPGTHPHTPESAIVAAAGLQHHPPLVSVDPGAVARGSRPCRSSPPRGSGGTGPTGSRSP